MKRIKEQDVEVIELITIILLGLKEKKKKTGLYYVWGIKGDLN